MGTTTLAHAPRVPSRWVGVWKARPLVLPGLGALAGASLLAEHTSLPWYATAGLAVTGAGSLAIARKGPRARLEEARTNLVPYREGRGKLAEVYHRDPLDDYPAVPGQREGQLYLGHGMAPGGPVMLDLWGQDGPHVGVFGRTDTGKSSLVNSFLWQAHYLWGWRTRVIDGKPGQEYRWLRELNGDEAVCASIGAAAEALEDAVEEMEARYEVLDSAHYSDKDRKGVDRRVWAVNWREVPQHVRDEWPPLMLVVEEAASYLAGRDELAKRAAAALLRLVQLGRSVGIHLVISMQRPDADLLPGFIKAQTGARVFFGYKPDDRVTADMVVGEQVRRALEQERVPAAVKGRAVAVGLSGGAWRVLQADLLDKLALMPREDGKYPEAMDAGAAKREGAPRGSGHSHAATPRSDPDCAELATPGAPDGSAAAPEPVRDASDGPASGTPRGRELRSPPVTTALRSTSGPVRFGALRSPTGSRSWTARFAGAARAVGLVAPLPRVRLRWGAVRLAWGPRIIPGPRPSGLRAECERVHGTTCWVCQRTRDDWQAEHLRPLWAGGSDQVEADEEGQGANVFPMCKPCHDIKTKWEGKARRWYDRWVGFGSLAERTPGYVWNALLAVVVALWQGTVGGPGDTLALLAAGAALAWVFRRPLWNWVIRPAFNVVAAMVREPKIQVRLSSSGRGLDGIATMDNLLEAAGNDTVADGARAQRWGMRKIMGARLQVVVVAGAYLIARGAVWALRSWLGV